MPEDGCVRMRRRRRRRVQRPRKRLQHMRLAPVQQPRRADGRVGAMQRYHARQGAPVVLDHARPASQQIAGTVLEKGPCLEGRRSLQELSRCLLRCC